MVGIMQSVPVIRSPQNITIVAPIGLFEPIGTISPQLIRTGVRIESPDPILRNDAMVQTASRNQ